MATLKKLETGEEGARRKGVTSEVILLGTSQRMMARNPFGLMAEGGAAGVVRWSAAMAGDRLGTGETWRCFSRLSRRLWRCTVFGRRRRASQQPRWDLHRWPAKLRGRP